MILRKTIKANVFALTKSKESMLREEYNNFQATLRGFNVPLYSATKQQAQRLLRKLKGKPKEKTYPLILRRDVFNIKETKNKLAKFWVKFLFIILEGELRFRSNFQRTKKIFCLLILEREN